MREHSVNDDVEKIIDQEVMELFLQYEWPGNISELKNVVQYSIALSDGVISIDVLPSYLQEFSRKNGGLNNSSGLNRDTIISVLEKNKFNKKRSAEELGISRKTLYEKMNKYEIEY